MKHSVALILILVLCLLLTLNSCMPSEEPASSGSVRESPLPASVDDNIPCNTTTPAFSGSDVTEGTEKTKFEPEFVFPEGWTVIECLNEEPDLLNYYNLIGESGNAFFWGSFTEIKRI